MSIVRISIERYREYKPEERRLLSYIWPVFASEEKYPEVDEKHVDIDELPFDLAEIRGFEVKPLRRVKFMHPDPAPNFSNFKNAEVREFIKTVQQIVMPGFELLKYGQIMVKDDECTDEIQECLDNGWRIIAVLPQPGNRRPDYILVREGDGK